MEIPFVQKRKESWQRLNLLLSKAGGHRIRQLSKEELLELSVLYRKSAADLARARAERMSPEIITLLNDLVGRAYNLIYRAEKSRWRRVAAFLLRETPALVRQNKMAFFFSCLLLLA
ncbi:MAG TPA: stage II sporulation protein M, partial [Bacillota bacterium]